MSEMDNDLQEKILTKINSIKHRTSRKSIITGIQTSYTQPKPVTSKQSNPINSTTQQKPMQVLQSAQPPSNIGQCNEKQEEYDINIEAQILGKFDQMLMYKVKSIQNVLTSIENKVQKIQPKFEIVVNNTLIFSKVQKAINESLDKSISGIKNSLSMSINYYNNELCEREKRFNKEHEQTARVAIENHKNTIDLKGKRGESDFKRLEERIKMLMRSENKCQDILGKIDKQLTKMGDSIRDFNQGFVLDSNFKSIQGEELIEISEQQLLEMILDNYQIKFDSQEMKDYIYNEIGVKQNKRK